MLPIFVGVLFGAIDGARLVVSQCMLNYAVIAGARLASVSSTRLRAVTSSSPSLCITSRTRVSGSAFSATRRTWASAPRTYAAPRPRITAFPVWAALRIASSVTFTVARRMSSVEHVQRDADRASDVVALAAALTGAR